jgi:hypothetical protein
MSDHDDSRALQRLWHVRPGSPRWAGLTLGADDPRGPDEVLYVRTWPDGTVDALRLVADARRPPAEAWRTDACVSPGVVWRLDGTIAEVVGALLALPAPGEPAAPSLVIERSARLVLPPGQAC